MSFCLLCVCLYATLTILICQYLKLLVTFNIATCDFTTISYFTLTACTPFDIIVIALVLRRDKICGCSSSGRAPPCQGGGSEFEPRQPLQFKHCASCAVIFAAVAHLVERHLAKVEVASSSLVSRSKRKHLSLTGAFFWIPGDFYYFWTAKPPKSGRGHSAAARWRSRRFAASISSCSLPPPSF